MTYDGYWYHFPKSTPRKARGGIKAQSQRGAFGQSWWAKRWIAVLEGFDIGARLNRGRSYARRGQVTAIEISEGAIAARVQGSRPRPYSVEITIKPLATPDWKKVVGALSRQAIFAAKLLAGEMPQDIEQAFEAAGLSLFPRKLGDLQTECSCPDWSNPCKHIAAVYYLLGEEFDRDPFVIFKLRGMDREKLVGLLGQSGQTTQGRERGASANVEAAEPEEAIPAPEPLPAEVERFWGAGELSDDLFGEVRVPAVPAAPLKRLGSFPFWRGDDGFLATLEPIYAQASERGMAAFLGEHP